jgi:hypothetical protein
MEYLSTTCSSSGIHIEGFPDAIKVIKIEEKKGQRLADLALHKVDLEFAKNCLEAIKPILDAGNFDIVSQALWFSAITSYIKCFGISKSRFQLDYKTIYKDVLPKTLSVYFKNLRNKHLTHDENSFSQSFSGAVLNKKENPYKIAKIITVSVTANTLTQGNYNNLKLLIEDALAWAIKQYNTLCTDLTQKYEQHSHESLLAFKDIKFDMPSIDFVDKPRQKH